MAEDSGAEKTEDPTAKRLEDAKKKGQIARSKETGTAFVLIMSAVSLIIYGPDIGKALLKIMKRMLNLNHNETYDTTKMFSAWGEVAGELWFGLAMFVSIILAAAFIGNTFLGGFNFSWGAAAPKASKMSIYKGFGRMFGPQAAIELTKALLKFGLIAGVAIFIIIGYFDEILHLSLESPPNNIEHSLTILAWVFLGLSCTLTIVALVDAPFQKWNHNKQLKMSLQEIKDEYKNSEGDPQIKARIRRTQREMSQRRMMQDVPDADVIVTNPTHYAVAIKYDTDKAGAPIVLAKGIDQMALQIRKIAKKHDVPVLESPSLARSLHHFTDIGAQIPDQLFVAVAQVLAYVFQLKQYKKGRGKRPTKLSDKLPIPDEFKQ